MVCLLVINCLLWFTSMQVQICSSSSPSSSETPYFFESVCGKVFYQSPPLSAQSISGSLNLLKFFHSVWSCFCLNFSLQEPCVTIPKPLLLTSIFQEGTLKHWNTLSLFALKWLIEIVFTKQPPSNKYIHPLLASKHTSYTVLSTFFLKQTNKSTVTYR